MLKDIDYKSGRIIFLSCNGDFNFNAHDYDIEFSEDMVQVEYNKGILLDIGWYSEANKFRVYVIQDSDWQEPLFMKEAASCKELYDIVVASITFIEGYIDMNHK